MRILLIVLLISPLITMAQFDPAGGESGSLSVHKDDDALYSWADSVIIERSWMDYADTSLGKVSAGEASNAIGEANGTVVSLGDGGSATYYFKNPIINSEGFEFAVFENGFKSGDGYFLELAFVEASKDGIEYYRFPAKSAADTSVQFSNADVMNPTWYHNLAGKHQSPYGTLFDINELDIDSIHYIRIIDIIGVIGSDFSSRDSEGRPINDSYPTAFLAGGFDIDALGLVNNQLLSANDLEEKRFKLYPSLIQAGVNTRFNLPSDASIEIFDCNGRLVCKGIEGYVQILEAGIYYVVVQSRKGLFKEKICVY